MAMRSRRKLFETGSRQKLQDEKNLATIFVAVNQTLG
jgi:hypothetical protein